ATRNRPAACPRRSPGSQPRPKPRTARPGRPTRRGARPPSAARASSPTRTPRNAAAETPAARREGGGPGRGRPPRALLRRPLSSGRYFTGAGGPGGRPGGKPGEPTVWVLTFCTWTVTPVGRGATTGSTGASLTGVSAATGV